MKRNQRGQANIGPIIVVVLVAFVLALIVVSVSRSSKTTAHHHRSKHVVAKGEFLKPTADGHGRYTYQADDGNWYIYYWMMTNNSTYDTSNLPPSLPSGGTWSKAEQPQTEEVVGQQTEEVAEANAGTPETEEEFTTENQTDIENQSVEPENTVEPSEPSSSPDSSPSDSGGDSGGGDSGGGGDGGSSD
jgi:uncharacterized membrane protein YgcG